MDDEAKTRTELIDELRALRRQLAEHTSALDTVSAEPAVRRSAHLFAQAFKVNPAAITITRLADGRFIDVNDRFLELLGYSSEEVIGHTSHELGVWAYPDERRRVVKMLTRQGVVRDADVHFRAKNGDILIGRTGLVFIDIDGEACALTVVQDVTRQLWTEQTQQFLIEASTVLAGSLNYETVLAELVRLAVAHLADWCAVDVYEEDGSIRRFVMPQPELSLDDQDRVLERHSAEIAETAAGPSHVLDTGRSEMMPEVSESFLQAVVQDPRQIEVLGVKGARSAMVVPLKARGRLLGAISFVTAGSGRRFRQSDLGLAEDLARRAALALDNALLYREAQQALQARDAFLSVAAHELKTPTTLILAHADLLQRRAERDATTNNRDLRSLRTLRAQTHRLNRLIQAVLDVSRLQGGALVLDRQAIDLVDLARGVVEEFSVLATSHTLSFAAPPEPQIVDGDTLRLEQVLQNLVQNAVKYSPQGSTIWVKVARRAGEVVVSVRDQGIGVPASVVPELFRPFYRARNVDPDIGGLGIGLYVVKEIVTLHGGSVQVASSEGEGSTFSVRLPLSVVLEEHHP
jgi:PAS domain S-box-containing protein